MELIVITAAFAITHLIFIMYYICQAGLIFNLSILKWFKNKAKKNEKISLIDLFLIPLSVVICYLTTGTFNYGGFGFGNPYNELTINTYAIFHFFGDLRSQLLLFIIIFMSISLPLHLSQRLSKRGSIIVLLANIGVTILIFHGATTCTAGLECLGYYFLIIPNIIANILLVINIITSNMVITRIVLLLVSLIHIGTLLYIAYGLNMGSVYGIEIIK